MRALKTLLEGFYIDAKGRREGCRCPTLGVDLTLSLWTRSPRLMLCRVYTIGSTGASIIFPREEMPFLESCRVLHTALRRSNPFWLVALRYSVFSVKSII